MPDHRATRNNRDREEPRKMRVLCAEDEKPLAYLMKMILEREGHIVECVGDGMDALERIDTELDCFDLLITDHKMPRMNGLELVTALRARPFAGKIAVHSAYLTGAEILSYRQLGVEHVLAKPLDTKTLIQLVRLIAGS